MPFRHIHPALDKALEAQGYLEPTPVQAAVLQAPDGADLLVSAQTGSGKTVAFGLSAAGTLLGILLGLFSCGWAIGFAGFLSTFDANFRVVG